MNNITAIGPMASAARRLFVILFRLKLADTTHMVLLRGKVDGFTKRFWQRALLKYIDENKA